jgi:hypothetical protein
LRAFTISAGNTILKKLFHFESSREHYRCDAAVVWCFDHRFDLAFRKFLKRIGVTNPDSIQLAGGAKSLSSPEKEADREFVLEQIRKSVLLHGTKQVILMVHSDCGAYGGLGAFRNDVKSEAAHHEQELKRAAETVLQAFPELKVRGCFVDFEAIWEAGAGK